MQLVKNGISLEKDKMYRISFKAQALSDRSATFYAGKASDPWNAYSGYNGISIGTAESNFVFSFTMTNPTDPEARLVFDLGKSTTGVTISEIKVEELNFVITAIGEQIVSPKVAFYPNPVSSILNVNASKQFQSLELYDLSGRVMARFDVNSTATMINMAGFANGIYLLRLTGKGLDSMIKIIKN